MYKTQTTTGHKVFNNTSEKLIRRVLVGKANTDNGQLIRCPIHNVRIASRRTQGVTLFNVGADAKVVSATRLRDVTQSEETETEPHGEDGASGNEGEDA